MQAPGAERRCEPLAANTGTPACKGDLGRHPLHLLQSTLWTTQSHLFLMVMSLHLVAGPPTFWLVQFLVFIREELLEQTTTLTIAGGPQVMINTTMDCFSFPA